MLFKSMKKVIITGATGQDGSYMAEYLLNNTENTIILAIRRTSQSILSNLEKILNNPRIRIVTLDLADGQAIRNTIKEEKPDYFINLGAQTFVADSWKHPEQHMQINAVSLIHILEAIREYVPYCRVYSAGSSEQFGDVDYSPQDIKHPRKPRSLYGVSKCAAELICKVYMESYGLYVVHGILFNHESPRRQEYFVTRKITMGVARIKMALERAESFEPIELGNLDAKRDWSHASDFMDGIWRMLNQEKYRSGYTVNTTERGAGFEIKEYILASGETHSIREFIEIAFEVAGIKNTHWYKPKGETQESFWLDGLDDMGAAIFERLVTVNPKFYRPADVELLYGDSSLARKDLGWKPKVDFKSLVREMVKSDLDLLA